MVEPIFMYNYSVLEPDGSISVKKKPMTRSEFIRKTGIDPYSKEYRNNPNYQFGQPHLIKL